MPPNDSQPTDSPTEIQNRGLKTAPDTGVVGYNSTDGLPFSSLSLVSIILKSEKFENGALQIFPMQVLQSGQNIYQSMSIEESLFSPIVSGNIILKDIGSLSDKLNLEGFEEIHIKFSTFTGGDDEEIELDTFTGIVTDFSLLTDDAVNANRMNSVEANRIIRLNFMNKDLFMANYTLPVNVPKNDKGITDFVGWISKKSSLLGMTSLDVDDSL